MTQLTLVFDLDGTLLNTAPDLLDSLNYCLKTIDLPKADTNSLMRYVGWGAKALIERAMTDKGLTISSTDLARLTNTFIDHYEAGMPGKTKAFDGASEMLARFADAGWILAVCTNKREAMSKKILRELKLADKFMAICGQETFYFKKPDPRHLTETIRMAGGDAGRAIMVGDSVTDIDTAKAAGVPVIAVSFGYSDRPIHEYEPSVVIDRYSDLTLELADRLLNAAKGR